MKSIILANQKGGVGKSTIASNILVWLSETQGYKTAGIDTDPQSSLYSFLLGRSELESSTKNAILFEDSHIPTLKDKLLKYKSKGSDIVVVDTKGHADASVIKSFSYVDKIIIPMQPSPIDYEATLPLLEILLKEGITNYKILINCVPLTSTKNTKEIQNELITNEIPCFNSTLGLRNLYKEAFVLSQGICEYEAKKANEANAQAEFNVFMEEFLTWVKGE